jgi:hypothetical protein
MVLGDLGIRVSGSARKVVRATYLTVPVVLSWMGTLTIPFSTHLDISKTAKDMAQDMKTDASARCMPENKEVKRFHKA